jgi:hypothetical protein
VVKTVLERDCANGDRNRNPQHGQQSDFGRRRRRRQVSPIVVLDVNVLVWRRRRRRAEIVKRVIRPVVVDKFVGRRRRKIRESLRPKVRRRFELGREHGEAAARVRDMRPLGIGVQIRPIGSRRIRADSPTPISGFSPERENGANPSRLVRVRISREELAIALQRVSLDSSGVGVRRRKTGDRPTLGLRE